LATVLGLAQLGTSCVTTSGICQCDCQFWWLSADLWHCRAQLGMNCVITSGICQCDCQFWWLSADLWHCRA